MPIRNNPAQVRQVLTQALQDKVISLDEADKILAKVEADGVTSGELNEMVETLTHAFSKDAIDVSTADRRDNINMLLGLLDLETRVPVKGNAKTEPGTMNFVGALALRGKAAGDALPVRTFAKASVAVADGGALLVGDRQPVIDLTAPNATLLDGLWAMNRKGSVVGDEAALASLAGTLTAQIGEAAALDVNGPGKFKRQGALAASLGALARSGAKLDSAQVDTLLKAGETLATPMQKGLLMRVLDGQDLSDAQLAAKSAIEVPEGAPDVLAAYDSLTDGGYGAAFKDGAAQIALSAMVFAKKQAGIDNIKEGMGKWDKLDGGWSNKFTANEQSRISQKLETYIEGYDAAAFVFGTFASDAPRDVASITSEAAVANVADGLDASPAHLAGYALTAEQATVVKTMVGAARDDKAMEALTKCLGAAGALFGGQMPSSYAGAPTSDTPLGAAAFAQFEAAARPYVESAEGSEDGKLGFSDLFDTLKASVKDTKSSLDPVLSGLGEASPHFDGIPVSAEAASFLQGVLVDHLKSANTVNNLRDAVNAFATANAGSLEGAGLETFKGMIGNFTAEWPDAQVFDFNKLGKIASYEAAGQPVPQSSLNGKPMGLGAFQSAVASAVADRIDTSKLAHTWMAERFGYRAKEAVEMLDILAENTAMGHGPIVELQDRFPGAEVSVAFSGRDGGHEQFIYNVTQNGQTKRFTQGSEGELTSYSRRFPSLFSATVGEEGQLDVKMDDKISISTYPRQSAYEVGDKIDFVYDDYTAKEAQDEGKPFETRSKIVEAEILGFTAGGRYKVGYTKSDGTAAETEVPLSRLRKENNPHWFKAKGDYFSDVNINLVTDKALVKVLEGADGIIAKHLPPGQTATMSTKELAKAQKGLVKDLMKYAASHMVYPRDKGSTDADSEKYHELTGNFYSRVPLGELVKIKKGVCRHQCILEHLLLQRAGIDSRLSSGSANTSSGNFRGYHIWVELELADGARYLSDQTWNDATISLWDGAYDRDKRRVEMGYRTARYDRNIVN